MSLKSFPSLEKSHVKILKGLVLITLVLAIAICALDNRNVLVSMADEDYKDSLPIYSVATEEKVVSITFDAAWGDEDLKQILGILEKHNCRATFFVTGDWASRYPEAIKRIYEMGHDIGSHGANHKHMTTLSQEEMLEELDGCYEVIKELTGLEMDLFRAPYGDYDENVVKAAWLRNYYTIQWDVDSLDWKDYGTASIIETVCGHKQLKNGSIILLHNGSRYTAGALDELLSRLTEQGYSFAPISELIYRDEFSVDHTGRQYKNTGD